MKEYPKCPYIVSCSITVYDGNVFSWTCLRLRRTVGRAQCEQCERTILKMIDYQCR